MAQLRGQGVHRVHTTFDDGALGFIGWHLGEHALQAFLGHQRRGRLALPWDVELTACAGHAAAGIARRTGSSRSLRCRAGRIAAGLGDLTWEDVATVLETELAPVPLR